MRKVLLKKLQKLKKLRDEPKSEAKTATKKMEQKEIKTELPAAPVIMDKISKTGKSSLKSQEVGKKTEECLKKLSQTKGCVNKDDVEWYQENINDAFDQLKSDLLKDN